MAAVIAGNIVSAQVPGPTLASLKTVSVPEPDNLGDFVKNKEAAIKLGKAFFWDMQVGSDGVTACASCHFHAGADNRSKNQIAPGLLQINADGTPNPDTTFNLGGAPNYQIKPENFPFHKLSNPNDRNSPIVADLKDVISSQGVFNGKFVDVTPGNAEDQVTSKPDPVFNVKGINVRRVQPRNTPSVINAVFNFRNFWDGRAQNVFNGVNPFGSRDPNATVVKAEKPNQLKFVQVRLKNSSLASQAVGPPLSSFEQSSDGRTFEEIGDKFGDTDIKLFQVGLNNSSLASQVLDLPLTSFEQFGDGGIFEKIDDKLRDIYKKFLSVGKGLKLPRKLGKKLFPLRPLGKQLVDRQDSVLGADSRYPQPGLKDKTYEDLIQDAFKPEWWKSNRIIQVDAKGRRTFVKKPDRSLETDEYTLTEYNFSLFFGLAVQLYESTLISNDTPFDRFLEGNTSALTPQQQQGLALFKSSACIACHGGAELTAASVTNVKKNGRISRSPAPGNPYEDTGFFKIGVRPELEDPGVGDNDGLKPVSRPLSEAQLAKQGKFQEVFGEAPNITPGSNDAVEAEGLFKAPGLRNIELTAPYMHNGGMSTLRQVVDFYSRGAADDNSLGRANSPNIPRLPVLNLSDGDKEALVVFLKSLTDERVRYDKAPFDHPQLFVPNGHPGNSTFVTDDGTGKATDDLLEISAVGRNGVTTPKPNFLN